VVAVPEEAKQVVKLTVIALAVVVARFAIYWVVTGSYVVGAAGLLGATWLAGDWWGRWFPESAPSFLRPLPAAERPTLREALRAQFPPGTLSGVAAVMFIILALGAATGRDYGGALIWMVMAALCGVGRWHSNSGRYVGRVLQPGETIQYHRKIVDWRWFILSATFLIIAYGFFTARNHIDVQNSEIVFGSVEIFLIALCGPAEGRRASQFKIFASSESPLKNVRF